MTDLLTRLDAWDREAFLAINSMHAGWSDPVMAAVSEMLTWFPLYGYLLFVLYQRLGWKALVLSVPVLAIMVLFSDKGSVLLFKENFQRLRPCHVPDLQAQVHMLKDHCGGRYGFVSSHASNHFAIAAFMAGILAGKPPWATILLFLWAAWISYSRIYLGVHYPGDVLVGALYGVVIGSSFFTIFRQFLKRIQHKRI
jgi:undecaprenyl-diphosphatase